MALCTSVLAALWYAYIRGSNKAKSEIERDTTKEALDNAITSNKIDDEVSKVPDSELDDKLSEWMRDNP